MTFDALDSRMRRFETADDPAVVPGLFVVVRLDGRGFTRLTKETLPLERPFDPRFRDAMLDVGEALLSGSGFRAAFAYSQSDELSLLLHRDEDPFGRRARKWLTVLAGEASARFSLTMGVAAAFDARLCPLPREEDVMDYFRWRQADAARNALNAHCYWLLRGEGLDVAAATARVAGLGHPAKHDLLFSRGINFNGLPAWHKRGCGLWFEIYSKTTADPRDGRETTVDRRRVRRETELPFGNDFDAVLRDVALPAAGGERYSEARGN